MQTLPLPAESLGLEQKFDGAEICVSLLHPKERAARRRSSLPVAASTFLASYVSAAVFEVFPDWRGILIELPVLKSAVWIVHDSQYGQQLANETGKPAILIDTMLAQQDRPFDEIQEALAPFLILPREKR